MLAVNDLQACYGESQVLFDVSLEVRTGEAVSLLGRNGMGKTTTLKCVMGIIRPSGGSVAFEGRTITGQPSYNVARAGLGLVPEGRQIFPNLTIWENLTVSEANRSGRSDPWTAKKVFELFPRLAERRDNMGNQLSGGEQQMLAIGRALMTNPKVLILDEATEGLAPLIRAEIWQVLAQLKSAGQSILLVDKHIEALTRLADRHYIVEKGRTVWHGTSRELSGNKELQGKFLGV